MLVLFLFILQSQKMLVDSLLKLGTVFLVSDIFLKPSTKVTGSRPYPKVTSAQDSIVRLPLKKRAHVVIHGF